MKMSILPAVNLSRRRHNTIISSPTDISRLNFDDLFYDISDNWEEKAIKLQARRWRRLKNSLG